MCLAAVARDNGILGLWIDLLRLADGLICGSADLILVTPAGERALLCVWQLLQEIMGCWASGLLCYAWLLI